MKLKIQSRSISISYIQITFAVLFFMWGLLTVLNFVLLDHLTFLFNLPYAVSTLINLTFFGSYLIVSLKAGTLIKKVGYKNGILTGWIMAIIGCFSMVAAISERNFNLFLFALFIEASGITILQVGANLYVVMYGDAKKAASRLTLVQAFNSLGTVLPAYLIVEALYKMVDLPSKANQNIERAQMVLMETPYIDYPYLILGILMTGFAVFLWFSKIPQIDIENEEPLNKMPYHPRRHVMHFPQLRLGAFAIFAYVGAEVALGNYLEDFGEDFSKFYWGGAMVGRFIGAFLLTKINTHKAVGISSFISAFLVVMSSVCSGLGLQDFPIVVISSIGLFNSILFPSIFALGVNGLGRFSLNGSSVLIMSIVGGAVIPFMVRNFSLMKGFPKEVSLQFSMIIPVICYLYIMLYGLKLSKYEKRIDVAEE